MLRKKSIALIAALFITAGMVVSCSDDDDKKNNNIGGIEEKGPTLAQVISEDSDLSTLAGALEIAGLTEQLQNNGPYTVFAPTNAAFDLLSQERREELFGDSAKLRDFLLYHMTNSRLPAANIENMANTNTPITTRLNGQTIATSKVANNGEEGEEGEENGLENVRLNYTAKIVEPDINARNGLVHKIDRVLRMPEDL